MENLTPVDFASLGEAQQKTYIEQLLVLSNEQRSIYDKVIISWFFRFYFNTKLSREEIEQMNFDKYINNYLNQI